MSYRTHLAIRQYKDNAEKEAVRKEAYSKMWMYVDKDGDFFNEDDWRNNCFNFDEDFEINSSDLTMSMIRNNPNFISDSVIDDFRAKTGQEFLIKKGEYDLDGLRVVSISKEDMIRLIQDCYQAIANFYKRLLQFSKDADEFSIDKLQLSLESRVKDWEYAANDGITLNKEGKLEMPYPLAWSYEYLIVQLVDMVNKYDWDCVDAVLYGG